MGALGNSASPDRSGDTVTTSIVTLRERTGPVQRLMTDIAASSDAGQAERQLNRERIQAEMKIARTGLALTTTKICSALVARAMPALGSLTVSLNNATNAVDATLTSATAADVTSHLNSRHANRAVLLEMERTGRVAPDEADVVRSFLDQDMAQDVERARARMAQAKEAVDQLHAFGLAGIRSAERNLSALSR